MRWWRRAEPKPARRRGGKTTWPSSSSPGRTPTPFHLRFQQNRLPTDTPRVDRLQDSITCRPSLQRRNHSSVDLALCFCCSRAPPTLPVYRTLRITSEASSASHLSTLVAAMLSALSSNLTSARQTLTQVLNFALVLSTAFMLWKGLSIATASSSPIVVGESFFSRQNRSRGTDR